MSAVKSVYRKMDSSLISVETCGGLPALVKNLSASTVRLSISVLGPLISDRRRPWLAVEL